MKNLVIVRGGGDIATGVVCKLHRCGFSVLILEAPCPSAIRRTVAFSEAVVKKRQTVEGIPCILAENYGYAVQLLEQGNVAVLVDPAGDSIKKLKPLVVVDAILAKRNLGTNRTMAPVTIGLGPGFTAGVDVDAVIETMRGHTLGRVIYEGCAAANTGVPGIIGGYGAERVIRSPAEGIWRTVHTITDPIKKGEVIAWVENAGDRLPVRATMDGFLRGLLPDGYPVTAGFKAADIDPREEETQNCFVVSDKARCIAGGVLEAILYLRGENDG